MMKRVNYRIAFLLAALGLTGCAGCQYISGGIVYCPDNKVENKPVTHKPQDSAPIPAKAVTAPKPKELTQEQKEQIEKQKKKADKRCTVLMQDFQSKYDVNHPRLLSVHGNKQIVICSIQYMAPQSYGANAPVTIILQGNFINDVYEVRQF